MKNIRRWKEQKEELEKNKYKKVKNNIGGTGHPLDNTSGGRIK